MTKNNFIIVHIPIVKQTGPPKIMFKKRLFVVGEKLIANCTTSRAKPAPHITWLVNGEKVKLLILIHCTTTNVLILWLHRHSREKMKIECPELLN